MQPKVLLYHDLAEANGGDESLARRRFRRQITFMVESGFTFRPIRDLFTAASLGSRDLFLTFDDGTRSFINCALPVLQEFKAPATMFCVTGFAGRRGAKVEFLSWDEMAQLKNEGIEIGSHSVSHVPLNVIDRDRMRREVFDSAAELRTRGFDAEVFAYPYGRCDEAVKAAVKEAGYRAAFTIKRGGADMFDLRRRLFTSLEGPAVIRFFLSDHYFAIRKAILLPVPATVRKEGRKIPKSEWGAAGFGIAD